MNQEEYLKQRVDDQINWYNSKSQRCQKSFKALRLFEITAAAMIPLLSGYVSQCEGLEYAVGFLGFCVAVVAGALGLFQYQERWTKYRITCEALTREKYLFLTGAEPYNVSEALPLFVAKSEDLMSKEQQSWLQRTPAGKKEEKRS
jgi:hypothetical protein